MHLFIFYRNLYLLFELIPSRSKSLSCKIYIFKVSEDLLLDKLSTRKFLVIQRLFNFITVI